MLLDGLLIMFGLDLDGMCVFGMIEDFVFNYVLLLFVLKMWLKDDLV